jgi:hypothetical protein
MAMKTVLLVPSLRCVGEKEAILEAAPSHAYAELQKLESPPPKLPKAPNVKDEDKDNLSRIRCFSPLRDGGIETGTPRLFLHHPSSNFSHRMFLLSHSSPHFSGCSVVALYSRHHWQSPGCLVKGKAT